MSKKVESKVIKKKNNQELASRPLPMTDTRLSAHCAKVETIALMAVSLVKNGVANQDVDNMDAALRALNIYRKVEELMEKLTPPQ